VALWRRGQLEEAAAVAQPAARAARETSALRFYERALALAPNEETYLLAAGRQALTLGDRMRARAYYRRALDAVPGSADARAGLAESGDPS
jgi:tetratricopeptide (TPR) repeat protein